MSANASQFVAAARSASEHGSRTLPRDPAAREVYLRAALRLIPRLLTAVDRNPFRPTYGCFDRQFWHYRTADFPSEMYQEAVWPLALAYATPHSENRWAGVERIRELVVAGIRFAARSSHRDGSCDDYFPYERALGAAVFSLNAAAAAYDLLRLDDEEIRAWFARRAAWLMRCDESGRLANHQALAALGLWRVGQILRANEILAATEARLHRALSWQNEEGWFDEYGGADPGYQSVTLAALAEYRRLSGAALLDEPLARGVTFARCFLHPDDSYGGEYGSRGTHHFYPHGWELLAGENADAADLADGFLRAAANDKLACFDDDRLVAHRLGSLFEAYRDWSPRRPPAADAPVESSTWFPNARLLVDRGDGRTTIVSLARGGTIKHFAAAHSAAHTDAGLVVETTRGRLAVSQRHDLRRRTAIERDGDGVRSLSVVVDLDWAKFETATPGKLMLFRALTTTIGRFQRALMRKLLQRRLITGRRPAPLRLTRTIELGSRVRVTDTIELLSPRVQVRRLALGVDHQAAYVAATGVYHDSALQPWTDLGEYVARLNADRRVTIVRDL